ncbi:MAG: hydroxypyruvate isomerase [Chloroflexi bacterium]|nr:hydroxypyruvate isomerase [Chloroflexota bacterium]
MPKLEANLQWMFNEYDVLDRYDQAAKLGFKGVEIQNPYDFKIEQIKQKLHNNNLKQIIINTNIVDNDTGISNLILRSDKIDIYKKRLIQSKHYAKELGCIGVNVGIGVLSDLDSKVAYETLKENLFFAAEELSKEKIYALIEPINIIDQPGYFINKTKQAFKIINQIKHQNLALQYDFYHMQIMEGNLAYNVKENLDYIKHIQLADNPGRNEPGTGEINYNFLLKFLDDIGYEGWVGCEYKPSSNTKKSLEWAKQWLS